MAGTLGDFTGLYQVAETLTFELQPQGKTAENLKKSGLLEQDFKRAEDYPEVKSFLDEQHKQLLQRVFAGITDIDWQPLADAIAEFQKNKNLKKDLEKVQEKKREEIVDKLKKDKFYPHLIASTPKEIFDALLESSTDVPNEIKTFSRFACYFKGFQENRKNIYSSKAQHTAASYRAVNENFSKFLGMVRIFSLFKEQFPDLTAEIKTRTDSRLNGMSLEDLFKIESYNQFLPQSGIDFLNIIVGEVNYAVNQYRQQHKELSSKSLPFMPVLYKQILSDREQAFAVRAFENDADLCSALRKFAEGNHNTEINGAKVELFASLQKELAALNQDSDLFIDAKALEKISLKTTGSWEKLQEAMTAYASKSIKSKKEQEKYCNRSVFNLSEIKQWDIRRGTDSNGTESVDITSYWNGEYANQLFETENFLAPVFEKIISQKHENLRTDKEKVNIIKEYLDAVRNIFYLVKPFAVDSEYGGDLALLGILASYYAKLKSVISIYNQTSAYITERAADSPKIKLMFNNPTLAAGWSDIQVSSCALFKYQTDYYLGVLSDKFRTCLNNIPESAYTGGILWKKMDLQQMGDPAKDLQTLMQIDGKTVRKTGSKNKETGENKVLEELKNRYLPAKINEIRKTGSYSTTNENFSRTDLNRYIDFYKERIIEYKSNANFCFKESAEYPTWSSFTEDINAQAYQLNFSEISQDFIMKLVDEGKLYLFRIYNKDFSPHATGTPNKFTLYWKEIFSPENLANVVFKLNAEAELFIRKQAIKPEITHAEGEKLVNKTVVTSVDKGGKAIRETIPAAVYRELLLYANGKKVETELSRETRHFLIDYPLYTWETGMPISNAVNKVIVKNAPFDIIKDKRFTEDKYHFHVPITINFKSPKKPFKFNEKVLAYLENNPTVKIIGIDRGERNLIYLTLINQQGEILKQKTLNIINGVNYHEKLDLREKERQSARKSWQEIGQIKNLKAGYLSAAVYEIAKMMIEENAIIIMENLNFGFKRGRMKIEKQVYQNFECALIEKLNYLVFKNQTDGKAPGSALAGYQLTPKIQSVKDLGDQCGFIFYVPAGYTSKIDPETGFINIFNTKECTSAESIKAFFDKFDSIRYSAAQDAFAFEFDYRNFDTHQKDYRNKWTVYSIADAWVQEKDKASGKFSAVLYHPTEKIKAALALADVKLEDGFDLLAMLRALKAENATASFFKTLFYAFKVSTALRHSSQTEDKIISPVQNSKGDFFISDPSKDNMPHDADANGAFHIALKGLYLLKYGIKGGKLGKISSEEWIKFAQTRNNK